MKTIVNCISLAIALLATTSVANAQNGIVQQEVFGATANGTAFGQGVTPTSADIMHWMPGRMWVGVNLADRGLGYSGSYGSFGFKNYIFEDQLDGRWLGEFRGHLSFESGDPFLNVGLMRVFSLDAAQSDVTTGIWFDFDGDKQGDFAHDFYQISGNLSVKTQRGILVGNGYFPIAETDYAMGGNFGERGAFFQNYIVLQPGIDSALQGYDVTWQVRPQRMDFINGTLEIGGYGYKSDQIPEFLGIHLGVGVQPLRGAIWNFELNHDDRFSTTAQIQITYLIGTNARGTEYGYVGRDLDPTIRNDHIVRYQQDFRAVIDPDTGIPYNVIHVSNDAAPGGLGTFESPFDTLTDAEAASITDDIIFVWEGDGTSTGYTTGIALKDRQFLLGDGVRHLVPTLGGTLFELPNNQDGIRPTISGMPYAVTLANANTVRGFRIDNSSGSLMNGIHHGGGSTITDGVLEDLTISNASQDGIHLDDIAGDWTFARNISNFNGRDGIFIDNACDPLSVFLFDTVTTNNNGRDGIHIEDYDGLSFTFTDIVANNNGRDGVRLERFKDGSAMASLLLFDGPSIANNNGIGINVDDYEGNAFFFDSQITSNFSGGLRLGDVSNNQAGTSTFVGLSSPDAGTTSDFILNGIGGGAGIDVDITEAGLTQNLLITDSSIGGITDNATFIINAGLGVRARNQGAGSLLNIDILDNIRISTHTAEGVRLLASNGATINGRLINFTDTLVMDGNGGFAGDSVELISGSDNGGVESVVNFEMRNISMNPEIPRPGPPILNGVGGSVIRLTSQDDGVINAIVTDVQADFISGSAVTIDFNNDGAGGINSLFMNNNNFTNITGNGVLANLGPDTFSDLSFNNMNLQSVQPSTTSNFGFNITATGSAAAGVDNMTRVNINSVIVGSVATPFDGAGISIAGGEDAEVLVNISNSTIQGAGQGGNNLGLFPFFAGIFLGTSGSSNMSATVSNNLVTGSGEPGLDVFNIGDGTMTVFADSNVMTGNDLGEDPIDDPIINAFVAEMQFANLGVGGDVCVALTNNFFSIVGTEIWNSGAVADFTLEIDGFSNSNPINVNINAGPPPFPPPTFLPTNDVTFAAFGTVCEPTILATEAAFLGAGFPDNP